MGFGYICPICEMSIRGTEPVSWDTNIRGELCRLIHVRDNRRIGWTTGHYNGSGGVIESATYRGEETLPNGKPNKNSWHEIWLSESTVENSFCYGSKRLLPYGETLNLMYELYMPRIGRLTEKTTQVVNYLVMNGYIRQKSSTHHEFVAKAVVEANLYADDMLGKALEGELDSSEEFEKWKIAHPRKFVLEDLREQYEEEWKEIKSVVYHWANQLPISYGESGTIAVHEKCFQSLSAKQRRELKFSLPDPEQGEGELRKEYL